MKELEFYEEKQEVIYQEPC